VVRVTVRDKKTDNRLVSEREPGGAGKRVLVSPGAVERQACVQDQTRALLLDLDATATDLVRAAMNADPHASTDLPATCAVAGNDQASPREEDVTSLEIAMPTSAKSPLVLPAVRDDANHATPRYIKRRGSRRNVRAVSAAGSGRAACSRRSS
jgi:hypothetical protein